MALKYGRRPPKNAPAIRFADIRRTDSTPVFPPSADYMTPLDNGWQMLGNDQYGDCVAVTWANVRRLVTHFLSVEKYPDLDQVFAFYKTQNPNFPQQDDGMDIQTALEDLHAKGGPDGVAAVAFAKVDHTNEDEIRAAIASCGYVWVGMNVLQANMTEFDNGEKWDYVAHSPLDGGHSVIVAGYGGSGNAPLDGTIRFETWAEETSFTDAFWKRQVEEAWVVIWPEHLGTDSFEANVSGQALADEYQALTGQPLVIPTPAPTPPPPAPEDANTALWDVAGPWCAATRVRADLVKLKTALVTWARANGLS